MWDYLVCQTNLTEFLTNYELCQLRQTCTLLKTTIDHQHHPYNWIQKCRFYDPSTLWSVGGCQVSCYEPKDYAEWMVFYWLKKLPSIIPLGFWTYFLRFMKGYVSMTHFQKWVGFTQQPLILPDGSKKWHIGMKVEIIGDYNHNNAYYPEDLEDIDEFISIGISLSPIQNIQESILGLNQTSLGWHSDDGSIYMDSLMVAQASKFGKGDVVSIIVDYYKGMVMFEKNSRVIHVQELSGEFLYNPLFFSVACKTMNKLFFHIL